MSRGSIVPPVKPLNTQEEVKFSFTLPECKGLRWWCAIQLIRLANWIAPLWMVQIVEVTGDTAKLAKDTGAKPKQALFIRDPR